MCQRHIEDFEDLFDFGYEDLNEYHHEESLPTQMHFKADVRKLSEFWHEKGNPFSEESHHLINIYTRGVACDEVGQCIFKLEATGIKMYKGFVKTVLIKKVNRFGVQSKTTDYNFLATNQNHQQIKHLQLSHFLKRTTKYFSTSLSTHRFDKEIQVIFLAVSHLPTLLLFPLTATFVLVPSLKF